MCVCVYYIHTCVSVATTKKYEKNNDNIQVLYSFYTTCSAALSFYLSTQCMHVQQLHVAPVFTELILNSIRNECVRRRGGGVVVVYGTRLLNYPHAATNSKKNLKKKKKHLNDVYVRGTNIQLMYIY